MITVLAPDGVAEVRRGDELADHLLPLVTLEDGDIVVVTSKVVSKTEGRVGAGDRASTLAGETERLVARRGDLSIVRSRLGLVHAAAGIDASNVERGQVALLPLDPDASARRLRAAVHERAGRTVGVVVTDTAGRPWREGQTDLAVGAAGLLVLTDLAGHDDGYGNRLAVTAPAVADEIAGAAELAQGKLGRRPFAVVRGRPDLVLPWGDDGPGAVALQRDDGEDLFGYGAREAVLRAVRGRAEDQAPFGSPVDAGELVRLAAEVADFAPRVEGHDLVWERPDVRLRWALTALAFACGWTQVGNDSQHDLRLRARTP